MPNLKKLKTRADRGRTIGWVDYQKTCKELNQDPLPDYLGMGLKVEVLSEKEMMKYQRLHLKQKALDLGDDVRRARGNNQTTFDLNQVECALDLSKHVLDWRGFYDLIPIDEKDWEALPVEFRDPEQFQENAKFARKVPVMFHRPTLRQLITQDLANFIVSLFFNKATAYTILEEEEFETETKNSASITPLVN